ncbi:hypothetical protein KAT82_04445 [bacterium]|nr:hypothetical protein [bacterium]
MKKALVRANLALLVVLTSPVIALAAAGGDGETIMDWFFRLLRWAAGGWHGF